MSEYDPNATVSIPTPAEPEPAPTVADRPAVTYHWIRGALWGLLLGLGLGIYALIFRIIDFEQLSFWLVVLLGVVLGVLWARFAPPKRR